MEPCLIFGVVMASILMAEIIFIGYKAIKNKYFNKNQ